MDGSVVSWGTHSERTPIGAAHPLSASRGNEARLPAGPRSFRRLSYGSARFVAGLVWSRDGLALPRDTPLPSLADVFYIGQYLFVIPAILFGVRAPVKERLWRGLLDASIMVIALGFAGYTFLVEPLLSGG